jgi:hypothetical protein
MKKALMVFVFFLSFSAFPQSDKNIRNKDVPALVKGFMKKNYPNATKVKYYIEKQNDSTFYEAAFNYLKDDYTLLISSEGKLYKTEIVILYDELPLPIKNTISKDLSDRFEKYTIKKVEQVNPDHELKYKINILGKQKHHEGYFDVYYNRQGSYISAEQETLKSIPSNSGF